MGTMFIHKHSKIWVHNATTTQLIKKNNNNKLANLLFFFTNIN